MTHSEYKQLTRRLAFLTREADRTRALLTMSLVITPAGDIVATDNPDQDGHQVEGSPMIIWRAIEETDTDIAKTMDGLVDGWTDGNQGRADQGLGPTADVRELVLAMSGFLVATGTPMDGFGALYPQTRERVRAWIDQANEWFPGKLPQPDDANTTGATSTAIDRERLKECFLGVFNKANRDTGIVPFDKFYSDLEARGTSYTTTDWGRVAHQVWKSKWALASVKSKQFAKWLRAFCGIVGVAVPKDIAPSRYKTHTDNTDFSAWLE